MSAKWPKSLLLPSSPQPMMATETPGTTTQVDNDSLTSWSSTQSIPPSEGEPSTWSSIRVAAGRRLGTGHAPNVVDSSKVPDWAPATFIHNHPPMVPRYLYNYINRRCHATAGKEDSPRFSSQREQITDLPRERDVSFGTGKERRYVDSEKRCFPSMSHVS